MYRNATFHLAGTMSKTRLGAVGYLLGLVLAELATAYLDPRLGFVLYALILLSLFVHAILERDEPSSRFFLALTLIPILRLVSLSLPLPALQPVIQVLATAVPVSLATILISHYLAIRPAQIGLEPGESPLGLLGYGLVVLTGVPLGLAQYWALGSLPILEPTLVAHSGLIVGILVFFLGLLDELIFRGILLRTSRQALGDWPALFYVSLLASWLYVGYGGWQSVLLAFGYSLFFGWVVIRTRTLYAVSLAHGIANGVLVMLAPLWFG
jgi:membrane protease YdiL (CAAX protease family)